MMLNRFIFSATVAITLMFNVTDARAAICPPGTYSADGETNCVQIADGFYGTDCSGIQINDYVQLDYIQGNGTYILLNYTPTTQSSFQFGITMLENTGNVAIGQFDNGDGADYRLFNAGGQIYFDYNSSRIVGGALPAGTYFDMEIGNNYVKQNGLQVLSGTKQTTGSSAPIGIFGTAKNGGARGRIHYFKTFENDTLIMDLYPVRRISDGTIGMYDILSDTLYTGANNSLLSAGPVTTTFTTACTSFTECPAGYYCTNGLITDKCPGGTFSTGGADECTAPPDGFYPTGGEYGIGNTGYTECPAGNYCVGGTITNRCTAGTFSVTGATSCTPIPDGHYGINCSALPDGYTKLEYIDGAGAGAIDTEHVPSIYTHIEFGLVLDGETGGVVVGHTGSNDGDDYRLFQSNGIMYWDYNGSRTRAQPLTLGQYYDMALGNNYVKQDGTTVINGVYQTGNSFYSVKLGSAKAKFYYMRIYENGSLIRDMYPAVQDSTGKVGMYDMLTNKFYTVTSGNGFKAGSPQGLIAVGCTGQAQCPAGNFCAGGVREQCIAGTWSTDGAIVCNQCDEIPEHASYTTAGWTNTNCPWECDETYGRTAANTCSTLCTSGYTHIKTSNGISIPLFSTRNTTPSINIQTSPDTTCYADLISGTTTNEIHVEYDGKTYHTVK